MKVSDYIAGKIAKHVNHVFCGNGGVVVHLLDSLSRTVKLIPCEHEQGAAIAAEGYARIHGFGCAIATSGPGFLNLVQGIACAYYDSVPVLYIVGAPPVKHLKTNNVRQKGFQEMDVCDIVRSFTKYAVRVTDYNVIGFEIDKAIDIAKSGRKGPVLIEIPDDVQYKIQEDESQFLHYLPKKEFPCIYMTDILKITSAFKSAKKPLVIVGGGVKQANAEKEVYDFLTRTGIPFVTTWGSQDMFTRDWYQWVGSFGISSNYPANFAVQNADVILILGSKLDTHQTGSDAKTFAPNAKKFIVDIDDQETGKNSGLYYDGIIHSDLKSAVSVLNQKVITTSIDGWYALIDKWKEENPICRPEYREETGYVNPYVFMEELSKATKEGDIIITDAGATLTWTMQGYIPKVKQALFSAFNHSPMGYALPAAIGAQFAAPDKQVICIIGDGGMQMNVQELATIAFNKLPIKIFMFDNNGYGIIRQTQDTWLEGRRVASGPESGLGMPDMMFIASAYKIESRAMLNSEWMGEIEYILKQKNPVFCRVMINPKQRIIPKLVWGKSIEQME